MADPHDAEDTADRMIGHFVNHLEEAAAIAITMNLDRKIFLKGAARAFDFWQRCHDKYHKENQ
jgi:hypothetical protein